MKILELKKGWRLKEAPLKWDKSYASVVEAGKEGWYDCDLPADVRMPLFEKG